MNLDRLPPHCMLSEQTVLGMMLDTDNAAQSIQAAQEVAAGNLVEWFYDLRHQEILGVILDLSERNQHGIMPVSQRLKDAGKLDQVGGIALLAGFQDHYTPDISWELERLKAHWEARQTIKAATLTIAAVYDSERIVDEIEAIRGALEQNLTKIAESSSIGRRETTSRELMQSVVSRIEDRWSGKIAPGIRTGYATIDKLTDGGLKPCTVSIIAGRPGVGKTSLAMNIGMNSAICNHVPVGVFSLEMDKESLGDRMLFQVANVDQERFYIDREQRDFDKVAVASAKIAKATLITDDSSDITIGQLRAKARAMVRKYGIKLIIIDYAQLLAGDKSYQKREEEISKVSRGVKAMAKELQLPVILLAQLSRDIEKETKPRLPKASDLRESGSLEQDADIILMLCNAFDTSTGKVIQPNGNGQEVLCHWVKNRNGRKESFRMMFNGGTFSFRELEKYQAPSVEEFETYDRQSQ